MTQDATTIAALLGALCFDANGLVPAIAQQHDTGEVLMMAWMNRDAVAETLSTGRVCYWSRSRGKLWRKGETSHQVQHLKELRIDCDGDTILLLVEQEGVACHTGRRACFFRAMRDGALVEIAAPLIDPENSMAELTPVTVLTGFLGAGKTTVLNHLLRQPALARTAVLVNEFGDIGIDHLLVEKLDENTVLLNAGCLCCTVRGDLVRTLREMLPRARRDEISRIIIETTGLAEPVPILATLMTDPVVASAYQLDGVLTVIDAVAGETNLSTRPEAVRQIAVADRIVLTKSDLADPTSLLKRIDVLNPGAPVVVARHGAIDPATILNAGLFNPASKTPNVAGWLHEEAHAHHHHDHDESVTSFCLTFDRPLHWQGMGLWLEMLIQTRGKDLLRIKGILNLHGQDRPVVIQAVQHVLHPPVLLNAWPEGDSRTSRIVFITQDLPRAMIEEGMRAFEAAATG